MQTYIDIATVDSSSIIPPAQESQAETATAMYGSGRAAQILTGAWDIAALKINIQMFLLKPKSLQCQEATIVV
ncbi:MAG: hypothetical protein ACLRIP_07490 [Blautia massiliensis (ex Durand et al. 2017)]